MTIIQGIFLGILQGVAEFLPISSSGHLAVVQYLFGLSDMPLLFSVILHIATLCAVCLFFRKRIWDLLCVFGRFCIRKPAKGDEAGQKMIAALVCGTAVTAVFGLILQKIVPEIPVRFVCAGFLVTALLLIVSQFLSARADRSGGSTPLRAGDCVSPVQGLLVGFAQGIGVLPGISRSGITISASLFAGIDRKTAGEFSFLLSIPAVVGALLLEIKDLPKLMEQLPAAPVAAGCIAAFAAGLLSLAFLMKLIKNGKLAWFACYLIPVGIAGLIWL